jgi:ATP-dependent helicase/nuclease subunit A
MTTLPEKMSISNLYPTVLDGADEDERLSIDVSADAAIAEYRLPEFISPVGAALSAKKGSATHAFLQFCNFDALCKNGVESELSRLVDSEFLSADSAKLVRIDEIERFTSSRLFNDIRNAKELFREFRISVMLPARLFTSDEDKKSAYEGSELLLQGVIDCLYSDENGKLHLIDYKTDRLKKEELEDKALAEKALSEKHALQLSYYALAVEKIFGQRPESVKIYSLHLGDTVNIKPLFF